MTDTAADVLRKALALMGPHGERWSRGCPSCGSYCVTTAIDDAGLNYELAAAFFRRAAGITPESYIPVWNDAPSRTFAEVKAAFEKAIALAEADRQLVTELKPSAYLVTRAYGDARKHYRWNGFMWRELPVETKAKPT